MIRSTRLKNQPWVGSPRPSSSAESAGVKVSALKDEMMSEKAIVSANWRYRMPVVPGKSATGTNTATSTRVVAITAPVTSRIAAEAAFRASRSPSRMWRAMFSITTIASSTTSPVASTIAKSVSVLIEKPNSLTKVKVPISDTGIVAVGISVARQSPRNRNITSTTRMMAPPSVITASRIDSPTISVEFPAEADLQARWEALRQPIQLGVCRLSDFERIRGRELDDGDADGVLAVELQNRTVVLGAELDAADVLEPDERPVPSRLHDDVLELRDLAQPTHRAHADLKALIVRRGWPSNLARRHLDVLLA